MFKAVDTRDGAPGEGPGSSKRSCATIASRSGGQVSKGNHESSKTRCPTCWTNETAYG